MLRSPLLMTWTCFRARSAKVHACGAQLKARISRNVGEGRESAVEIPRKKNSLTAALAANIERLRTTAEREKSKIGRAAASVHDEWKKLKGTKIMKKQKRNQIDLNFLQNFAKFARILLKFNCFAKSC